MSKKWETISLSTNIVEDSQERKKRVKKFDNIIRKIPSKVDVEVLGKENVALYEAHKAQEDNLLQAYLDKKLKSPALIKRAKQIKKARTETKKAEAN